MLRSYAKGPDRGPLHSFGAWRSTDGDFADVGIDNLAGGLVLLRPVGGAVSAALDLPWTTSPVEGQVNRIKTIKRSMYGRAGFDLLRARVLHAA